MELPPLKRGAPDEPEMELPPLKQQRPTPPPAMTADELLGLMRTPPSKRARGWAQRLARVEGCLDQLVPGTRECFDVAYGIANKQLNDSDALRPVLEHWLARAGPFVWEFIPDRSVSMQVGEVIVYKHKVSLMRAMLKDHVDLLSKCMRKLFSVYTHKRTCLFGTLNAMLLGEWGPRLQLEMQAEMNALPLAVLVRREAFVRISAWDMTDDPARRSAVVHTLDLDAAAQAVENRFYRFRAPEGMRRMLEMIGSEHERRLGLGGASPMRNLHSMAYLQDHGLLLLKAQQYMAGTMLVNPNMRDAMPRLLRLQSSGMRIPWQLFARWLLQIRKDRRPVSTLNLPILIQIGRTGGKAAVMVSRLLGMLLTQLTSPAMYSVNVNERSLRGTMSVLSTIVPTVHLRGDRGLDWAWDTANLGLLIAEPRTRRVFEALTLLALWFGVGTPSRSVADQLAASHLFLHSLGPTELKVMHQRAFTMPTDAMKFTIALAQRVNCPAVERALTRAWQWRTISKMSLSPAAGPRTLITTHTIGTRSVSKHMLMVYLTLTEYARRHGVPDDVMRMVANQYYQAVVRWCGQAVRFCTM